MKVINSGHKYKLNQLDGDSFETLTFVNRGHDNDHAGTNNQEVLRVLIDRVTFMHNELPWHRNAEILMHLRKALVLHEARHLERLIDKDQCPVEKINTGHNGHFVLGGT